MTIESAVKLINKRVKEISKVFGKESYEYMQLKSIIAGNLPRELIRIKDGIINLSRSKKVTEGLYNYEFEMEQITSFLKGTDRFDSKGREMPYTALRLSRTYDSTMTGKRLPNEIDRIRQQAMARAAILDIIEDYYASIDDIDDPTVQLEARQKFADRRGTSGQTAKELYEIACNFVKDALANQATGDYGVKSEVQSTAYQEKTTIADLLRGGYTE